MCNIKLKKKTKNKKQNKTILSHPVAEDIKKRW